ncbi:hypothetical protein CIB84_000187 [Bambusicola thoracicus]|uniref:Uncharacterized protein n=1 Tax=Bambusicola thoracicus TaxID=9083 RepID=A0A2P4TI89_BAMTH|nr:hypothetical protein CIB84_000187 [Bambusicola thoracicus]
MSSKVKTQTAAHGLTPFTLKNIQHLDTPAVSPDETSKNEMCSFYLSLLFSFHPVAELAGVILVANLPVQLYILQPENIFFSLSRYVWLAFLPQGDKFQNPVFGE